MDRLPDKFSPTKKLIKPLKALFNSIIFLLLLLVGISNLVQAQSKVSVKDSLLKIENTQDKSLKTKIYISLGGNLVQQNLDLSFFFFKKAEILAKEINSSELLEEINLNYVNAENVYSGNYTSALYHAFDALKYRKINLESGKKIALTENNNFFYKDPYNDIYFQIAYVYAHLGNKEKCQEYLNKIDSELIDFNSAKNAEFQKFTTQRLAHLVDLHILINELGKAQKYLVLAQKNNSKLPGMKQWGWPYILEGNLNVQMGNYQKAIKAYHKALPIQLFYKRIKGAMEAYYGISDAYFKLNLPDSSLKYGKLFNEQLKEYDYTLGALNNYNLLSKVYSGLGNDSKAYLFLKKANDLRDSLYNNKQVYQAQNFATIEQDKNDALDKKNKQTKLMIGGLCVLFVIAIFVLMMVQSNAQKRKFAKIEEHRKTLELEAAKKMQMGFLPKKLPITTDFGIATFIRSSTEVGGDYYDFIVRPDQTILSICGDATGHGVASGMMVSVTKASLMSITETTQINLILKKLNQVVRKIDLGTLRMSLNIVEFQVNKIRMASAAMPPIFIYKASTKKVEEIIQSNLPLGGFGNEEFDLLEKDFEPGDVVIQLSDGLPEAPNPAGEMFDYFRVKNHLEKVGYKSAEEIKNSFVAEADNWLSGLHTPDDITLVIIKKNT
jgi:tetratricopeptide (TPR) repeat protein